MPGITDESPTAGGDELDDLFDYDVSAEDIFRQFQQDADRQVTNENPANQKPDSLGIEEEVKVAKKRAPIAKLDANRLLSPAGIPKLRRITKDRLKIKGKGHEFTDVVRLLNLYQLWLDDLYPRAKFADGLAIIEKLGHTKRIQTMRKEWIDESKPKEPRWEDEPPRRATAEPNDHVESTKAGETMQEDQSQTANSNAQRAKPLHEARDADGLFVTDDEGEAPVVRYDPSDELDALLAEDEVQPSGQNHITRSLQGKQQPPQDEPDDLDALLAEDEARASAQLKTTRTHTSDLRKEPPKDDFAAEEEAMAEFDMW